MEGAGSSVPGGGGGKLAGSGNMEKFTHEGSLPFTTGNATWQAASRRVSTALLATLRTAPSSPLGFGFGRGLHLSEDNSTFTNGISGRLTSPRGLLIQTTGNRLGSVISGIWMSGKVISLSIVNPTGKRQPTNSSSAQKTSIRLGKPGAVVVDDADSGTVVFWMTIRL